MISNKPQKHRYIETFTSFQGEGHHTGKSTCWIRFFHCNLSCDGFGQKDPTDPSTYILPYKDYDVSKVIAVEELPVWEFGCDSSYSWSKKYRHLAHEDTAETIVKKLSELLKHETNPDGLFVHPQTGQDWHMAFTGGEPLLKRNQAAIVDILNEFVNQHNVPINYTVETNGTQVIKEDSEFFNIVTKFANPKYFNWFWSVSPKLWSTSGEKPKKAIKPEAVASYYRISPRGQLKYVVNGSKESWDEVEEYTQMFREAGVGFPVYIMCVGATKESQEDGLTAEVANEAMKRGYYFSGRLHASVYGNLIGT